MAEPGKEHLLRTAHLALEAARKAGAEWCDVVVSQGQDVGVEIENGSISAAEVVESRAVSVRAFVAGGRGLCVANGYEEHEVEVAAERAVRMAQAAEPDPDFKSLPDPEPAGRVAGLYDAAVADMPVSRVVEIAAVNIDGARAVEPTVIVMGDVGKSSSSVAVVNSAGAEFFRRGSHLDVGMHTIIRRGGDAGSFFDFDTGRRLRDVDPLSVGQRAATVALTFLGAKTVRSARMPVVLGPLASYSLLGSLAWSTNAENIQRRRSFMVGRLGQKVGSSLLTLTDDGLIPAGLRSGSHDGEGAVRRRVLLFEDGVFRAMLHNSYTAGKANEPDTGHGNQGGGISPTNLQPRLGTVTSQEIIADTKEGLYINVGSLGPDPASGDISSSVDFGFKIENGRLAYPVTNTMISGHIFEVLANIDAVSSDYREEPGNRLPTIRIRDMQVAGAG